jgi:hypothetical protein
MSSARLGSVVGQQQLKVNGQLVRPPGVFDPAGRGVQLSLADAGNGDIGNGDMRFYDLTARTTPIGPWRRTHEVVDGAGEVDTASRPT